MDNHLSMYNILDENIGSARDNLNCAVHNWYKFTAGFSYKLIDMIVENNEKKPTCVYDPFAGCGTTLVECQKLSIPSLGNESQALMCDIINAKLNWDIEEEKCLQYLTYILKTVKSNERKELSDEYNDLIVSLYDKETLHDLYVLRDAIREIEDYRYRLFFNLALCQVLHKVSIYPIAVPYISRNRKQADPGNAISKLEATVEQMIKDISTMPHKERLARVFNHDSRKVNSNIPCASCDLCITSPPYLNNLDYGEVSKVPSHFFGITNNWSDITQKVRQNLVTASTTHYIDSKFILEDFRSTEFVSNNQSVMAELETLFCQIKEQSKGRKGKKSFHIMMMYYFYDMYFVLKEMRRVLKEGSPAYLILGDSAPYGVYVETTRLLGEIAHSVGFGDYNIKKIRSRGTKWKSLTYRHNLELSENILKIQ